MLDACPPARESSCPSPPLIHIGINVGLIFTRCPSFLIEGIKLSGQKEMNLAKNTLSFVYEIKCDGVYCYVRGFC